MVNAPATSYVDSGLTQGQTYIYRVFATDGFGGSVSEEAAAELATLTTFTAVTAGMVIDDAVFHEILIRERNARRRWLGAGHLDSDPAAERSATGCWYRHQ